MRCLEGARVVQDDILSKVDDPRLKIFMVWTPAYGTDNSEFAKEGVKILRDKRVVHYWDAKTELSLAFGGLKKLPRDAPLAYDVFYVYAPDTIWDKEPPEPEDWMHQIVDDERYLQPAKMIASLKKQLSQIKK